MGDGLGRGTQGGSEGRIDGDRKGTRDMGG